MSGEWLQDITQTTGLYYYLTMKEFERAEEHKNKRKSKKLESHEKQVLHEELKSKLSGIFSFSRLQNSIVHKSISINTYDELFSFFSKANMFEFIREAKTLNDFFPCSIIAGNYAWISKTENGHYRYFSKSKETNTIGFDLIDLLEIYFGLSTAEAVEKSVKEFNIKFMEDVWAEKQNNKYQSHLQMIHKGRGQIKQQYPVLFDCLEGHFNVLEVMNVIASLNIKKQEFAYEGQNIFFASTSYIANLLGDYTLSTTNKMINLFAVLGLIKKVEEEHVPSQLLQKSKMIAEKRNLGNIISYYIIPAMMDVLPEAEKRAEILLENHISYSNINRAKIAFVFGEDFARTIYVQEVQKNKIKKSELPDTIHHLLEKNFLEIICKNGYTTKKQVAKKHIRKTTAKDREKELEKIWKSLLVNHQLTYTKPSKSLKEEYGLKTNEYIALR